MDPHNLFENDHQVPVSLDQLMNINAPSMYLVRIDGDSMEGAGIFNDDLIVVDRSIEARSGHIVVAAINGEPMCKRLVKTQHDVILASENKRYPSRYLQPGDDFMIWGVVTYSVRSHGLD